MKIKKVLKAILKVIAVLIVVLCVGTVIALNYKTVLASHKMKDIVTGVESVDDFKITDETKIVGLGEATHGNVEFQELRLEILKKLVEEYGFSAFALEADFGDCLAVNEYINGADGDAREIVNNLSFTIYHTEQMAELVEWMHDYNESASGDKKIRFYGFDMQNPEKSVPFVLNYLKEENINDIDVEAMNSLAADDYDTNDIDSEAIKEALEKIRNEADSDAADVLHAADTIEQCLGYWECDPMEILDYRDKCMAENVDWILEQEKNTGSGRIMISGHDGHVAKTGQNIYTKVTMGSILKEKYGEDYYIVGTDFFKGSVNSRSDLDSSYTRKNYKITSADPVAYQAKYVDDKRFYIDFENASGAVYDKVHSDMDMGTVGEGFSFFYYLMPSAYRINMVPADLYDAIICYYKVTPTDPAYEN